MKWCETSLAGAWLIEMEPVIDERGFFARSWCQDEFAVHGANSSLVQCGVSHNRLCGTLRGLHYQVEPHAEAKLVRCTAGAIYDVLLDLRQESVTYGRWEAFLLDAVNLRMIYVPEGVAHGFQTLEDASEVFYQISAAYHPECAKGVRWDDPAFGIAWPLPVSAISERDRSFPLASPVC